VVPEAVIGTGAAGTVAAVEVLNVWFNYRSRSGDGEQFGNSNSRL